MFLLNKNPEIIDVPWKLAVIDNCLPIDVADHLRDNFPKYGHEKIKNFYQLNGPQNMHDHIFKSFFEENWFRRKEINDKAHDILNIAYRDSKLTRWNYTYFPAGDPHNTIRDWHTDLMDKRVQFILYLGYNSDCITFEAGDGHRTFYKMPFVHNRLIFWHATKETWHRFFYCKTDRYTVNLTSQTARSNTNYLGLENYVSQ